MDKPVALLLPGCPAFSVCCSSICVLRALMHLVKDICGAHVCDSA